MNDSENSGGIPFGLICAALAGSAMVALIAGACFMFSASPAVPPAPVIQPEQLQPDVVKPNEKVPGPGK